jgi:signal transduction histidine kinase
MAWTWGVNIPIAPLIFGAVIVLAGILLTARHALLAGATSGVILLSVQLAVIFNVHQPDMSWTRQVSGFGDILAYCTVFGLLALVSWLYTREMERALSQARQAEAALIQQRSALLRQAKERTKVLRRLQLEEMRHMYHFAELGQLGITLLHDLANHLTTLTLELEDIEKKQHSKEMARVQQIARYIGDIVDSTRQRLHGETHDQTFDIVRKTSETIDSLHYKAVRHNVIIDWQEPSEPLEYVGDPVNYSQIIAIITSNAIDAYGSSPRSVERRVIVTMQYTNEDIAICVSDWGKGITKSQRSRLFKPRHSAKESGLGLGLYIAKQTAEMLFGGTIKLDTQSKYTKFVIKLPRNDKS